MECWWSWKKNEIFSTQLQCSQIFSRLTGQANFSSRSVAPTALKFSGRIAAWLVEMTRSAAAGL